MKLNGWQRLWVVVSGSLFFAAIAIAFVSSPINEYDKVRLDRSLELVGKSLEGRNKGYKFEGADYVRSKYYKDLSDAEIIKKLHEKHGDLVNFSNIEKDYQNHISQLPLKLAKHYTLYIGIWAVSMIALYTIGLATGWIISGFKKQ